MDIHTLEFDGTKLAEILPEGVSKAELARKVGVSRQAIHDISVGRRKPSADLIVRITAALNIEVSDLTKNFSS